MRGEERAHVQETKRKCYSWDESIPAVRKEDAGMPAAFEHSPVPVCAGV